MGINIKYLEDLKFVGIKYFSQHKFQVQNEGESLKLANQFTNYTLLKDNGSSIRKYNYTNGDIKAKTQKV